METSAIRGGPLIEAELLKERDALATAERHLAEGAGRLAEQERLANRLAAKGHDTRQADLLARVLRETLGEWRTHYAIIQKRIADLEARGRRGASGP